MSMEQIGDDLSKDPLSRLVNHDIEQAFLGACLLNNAAYERCADGLKAEDFGYAVHGRIYAAIGGLIDKGQIANPVTLQTILADDLKDLGGPGYLGRLAGAAPTISNAPGYAAQIADLSTRRKLIEACNDTIADAATVDAERPSGLVIEEHEQRVFELAERKSERGPVMVAVASKDAMDAAQDAYRRAGLSGVSTGLADLDRAIGGLMSGNLEIIAGRPSMGKTSLAVGIAFAAARNKVPVAIFSLEETRGQLAQRMLAMLADVGADRQRRGDLEQIHWQQLMEAQQNLDRLPIVIDDTSGLSVAQIVQRSRRLRRRSHIGLVIVDHLQHVRVPGKTENRRLEIGSITRALKTLAKDLGIPVVLLSQLSRAVESRDNKRPVMSDLRESGDIEQDADRVMFVFRQEYYLSRDEPTKRPGEADDKFNDRIDRWERDLSDCRALGEVIIDKNRHGPASVVRVHWDAERTMFGNLARG